MASRDYGQHDGITRALELVGERWALPIVRDLLVGPRRYGELAAGLPRIPTNILAARLEELQAAGVLRRVPHSRVIVYELTPYGRDLEPVVLGLGAWGFRALDDPREEQVVTLDALTISLRTAFRTEVAAQLPATAYAVHLGPAGLLVRVDGPSLDVTRGDGPADLAFAAGPGLHRVISGHRSPDRALETGAVELLSGTARCSVASRAPSTWRPEPGGGRTHAGPVGHLLHLNVQIPSVRSGPRRGGPRDAGGAMRGGRAAASSRPTLHSVAAAAGVSHQTVSNVLNAPERVRPETRDRVLRAVDALAYRPDESARSLVRRSTRLVSFNVGQERHDRVSMLDDFARALARVGESYGYRLVLDVAGSSDAEQIASFQDLTARRAVDGVVIPSTHVGDTRPDWLVDHGVPVVAFGRPWHAPAARHSWVDVDGAHGMRLVGEHLLAGGGTRIAYVGPPRDGGMEDDRLSGLLDAVAGAERSGADVQTLAADEPAELWDRLPDLLRRERPDALVCRDDSFAFEALQVLAAERTPEAAAVAVTGFDDSRLARMARPGLTSVAQPLDQVASLIWSSLVAQVEGREDEPLQRLIRPSLVVRPSSSGPRPAPLDPRTS